MNTLTKMIMTLVLALGSFFVGCKKGLESPLSFHGETMGTSYNILFFPENEKIEVSALQQKVNQLLFKINQEMSTYVSDSEISRFNYNTKKDQWFLLKPMFLEVVTEALKLARLTDGAFDPTVGPLVNLWGFGPYGKREIPDSDKLNLIKKNIGYKKLELDIAGKRLRKLSNGVQLDLSAIAKGFGVDSVSRLLSQLGLKNYMVEIGGEVVTKGTKQGLPWKIGIEAPSNEANVRHTNKILYLKDMAVATSGSYRNFFESEGKNYSHTIDSSTGRPVEDPLVSVTVLDQSQCMLADGMATALMAMGHKRAKEFAFKHKLAVYFIYQSPKKRSDMTAVFYETFETPLFEKLALYK